MAFLFRPKNINFSQYIWILSQDIVPLTKSDSGQIKLEDMVNRWGWHILEGKKEKHYFWVSFLFEYSVEGKKRRKQNFCLLFLFMYSVGDTIVQ